jgi:hypothetical protein
MRHKKMKMNKSKIISIICISLCTIGILIATGIFIFVIYFIKHRA